VTFFALGYWLYFSGLKGVRASIAAPFLSLIPVFGVAGGYVFLGERLVAAQWVGGILILLAITGIARQQSTSAQETD
jgi:drug/metabolite transporter (DMT)-like permease